MHISNPYENKHYKLYFVFPLVLIVAALFYIPQIPQGIDLRGGLLITVFTDGEVSPKKIVEIQGALAQFGSASIRSFSSPAGSGVEIEIPSDENLAKGETLLSEMNSLNNELVQLEIANSPLAAEKGRQVLAKARELNSLFSERQLGEPDARKAVEQAQQAFLNARSSYRHEVSQALASVVSVENASFKEVGSSLSKFFVTKTREVVLYSFILSAVIIFLIFRAWASSFAVIFGAVADIVITAGVMGLVGIPLTLASVAALLMLIGFSLDTDVMLTARVVKRKEGTAAQRAFDAMKTGLTMNASVLIAFGTLLALSLLLQIPFYYQVGAVAVIGALVDSIATWMGNAPLILWSVERKEKSV
ncbi:MAG: hypothetical protein QXR53_03655 [Candidatus Norongarragalinales archaeon]